MSRDEFVKRVDPFVKNFQGTKIDSFIVSFYLDCEQSTAIDPWISFAIARRVERIFFFKISKILLTKQARVRRTNKLGWRKKNKEGEGLM